MRLGNRELVVVGDRVLIKLDRPEERTRVGLYLPQTVVEKEKVASGHIVATGPGIPLPAPEDAEDEHWKETHSEPRFIPMQAEEGDYALFLKGSAVEIRFEGEEYLVVPQSAILILIREYVEPPAEWPEGEI